MIFKSVFIGVKFSALICITFFLTSCERDRQDAVKVIPCLFLDAQLVNLEMSVNPLYTKTSTSCDVVTNPDTQIVTNYYSDNACSKPISFLQTDFKKFCSDTFVKVNKVGDPRDWTTREKEPNPTISGVEETKWTTAQGARLKLLAVDQSVNKRPYLKRIKTTYTADGKTCPLEMRIYKEDINATDLPAVVYIHGGGWIYRAGASLMADMMATNLTAKGKIVFSFYYPLAGDNNVPEGCANYTGEQIVESVTQSLDWVIANGDKYGRDNGKISLIGQSSGSHLVLRLAIDQMKNNENNIKAVANLYGPTDFKLLVTGMKSSIFVGREEGIQYMEAYLKTTLDTVDINSEAITNNNFATYIKNKVPTASETLAMPAFYTLHGTDDATIPVESADWLCKALKNETFQANSSADIYSGGEQINAACNDGNTMTIISDAIHILDLQCFLASNKARSLIEKLVGWASGKGDVGKSVSGLLCPSGSADNTNKIGEYLTTIYGDL